MTKVITYGTYDLLHYGHIRLLERAKKLGDYLIVGVTADDFDKTRGKINVQQSLMERIEAVRATGLADKIIVEEYEGQKIDDIRRYDVDIFTVGSDWIGKFDYLKEYCRVVYLERTEGVSSSEIRSEERKVRLGIIGDSHIAKKYIREAQYVNGLEITGVCTENPKYFEEIPFITQNYERLLEEVDAAYERLSQAEDELYKTNEQIHYAGQYLSTKEVQQQFTKAIFKKKFRAEHSKELDAYAESVKYFREENDGKLPSLKSLKKRKEELTKEIAERKKAYAPLREESKRLEIASDNVYSIFRKTNEMKSDLAWKREWEANVREKARQEQARQEQRERQPKRKKRSYDMSL